MHDIIDIMKMQNRFRGFKLSIKNRKSVILNNSIRHFDVRVHVHNVCNTVQKSKPNQITIKKWA